MSDLIRRQDALDAIDTWRREYPLDLQEPIDDCWNSVRELPAVQPDHVADISKKVEEEDCISRRAAIDAMKDALDPHIVQFVKSKMAIEALPSAQPEPHWIPCSERLPDDLAEVNVTWVNHEPEPYYEPIKSKPFTASAVYYEGNWYWYSSVCADVLAEYGRNDVDKVDDAIEITAWKPLPEPYRGGDT